MTAPLPAEVVEAAESQRARLAAPTRPADLQPEPQRAEVVEIRNANGYVVERHHRRGTGIVVELVAEQAGRDCAYDPTANGRTGISSQADMALPDISPAALRPDYGHQPHRGILS